METSLLQIIRDFGAVGVAGILAITLFIVLKTKTETKAEYPNYLKRIMDIQQSITNFEENHFDHINEKLDMNIAQHTEIIVKLDLLRETTRELLTAIIRKMEK